MPSDHVYVRHLAPVGGAGRVVLRADPPVPGTPADQWRPSPALEPGWLRAHAMQFDVLHVHFGFEHRTSAELAELVGTLRELRRPLVLTVHDLDNPHLVDQRPHVEALDVLVPAAAAVITLTPGAALQIADRWGVAATVLAHPHVVGLDRLGDPRPSHDDFVVALHAKKRAGHAADTVRAELEAAVDALPGARLDPAPTRRLTDAELWDRLSGIDVLVLAYRSGTHSGFVEACHDLGTTVVAPRHGLWCEQQPVVAYDLDTPGSLSAALRWVHDERPSWRADPDARRAQRDALAAAHADLYAQAVRAVAA